MKNKQTGFALASTIVALVIGMVALMIGMKVNDRYQKIQELNSAVQMQTAQVSQFFRAVDQYVQEKGGSWTKNVMNPITVNDLQAEGLLPNGWSNKTAFQTNLAATGAKIDDPGNPGQTVDVFVVYETSPGSADYNRFLESFGINEPKEREALKRRIAKAYYEKDMLGGLVPPNSQTMQGITHAYTKALTGFLSPDAQPMAVAVKGFPDLAGYEPSIDITVPGGGTGGGIGGNAEHGEKEWRTPGFYTWTVPDGVSYIRVEMAGAAGGKSSGYEGGGGVGIGGMTVRPGDTLNISVGAKGAPGNTYYVSGGGGGRTAVWLPTQVIAAVGGGAGGCQNGVNSSGYTTDCSSVADYINNVKGEGCFPDDNKGNAAPSTNQPSAGINTGVIYNGWYCSSTVQKTTSNAMGSSSGSGGGLSLTSGAGGYPGGTSAPYDAYCSFTPSYAAGGFGGGGWGGSRNTCAAHQYNANKYCWINNRKDALGGGGGGYIGGAVGYGGSAFCPGLTDVESESTAKKRYVPEEGYVYFLW